MKFKDGLAHVRLQKKYPWKKILRNKLEKFHHFLTQQLSSNIFRAKGILWFQESPARHFFQLTGQRFQLEDSEWSGPRSNQLVFIGQGLDQDTMQQLLEDCVAPISSPVTSS